MTLRLSLAGESDVPAIMSVMTTAFDDRFGEAWSAAQLLGSLASSDCWARLAVDDGQGDGGGARPVGFSICRRVGPEAELLLVGVHPDARRRGLGASLLATARLDAVRRGVAAMFLEVRDSNTAALALYRASGFVAVGRRRDYYRGDNAERFDAITMRCELIATN